MKKLLLAAALAATCAALPSYAATDAECTEMWKKADVNHDGTLTDAESMRYAAAMRVHKINMPADGKLTQAVFTSACKADAFNMDKADADAPLKGANSFTEGQAKDRAIAHGATGVDTLTKDADGIWRGTAQMDGKASKVAVDYKGNVVFTAAAQ
jgi:hypothetical protein